MEAGVYFADTGSSLIGEQTIILSYFYSPCTPPQQCSKQQLRQFKTRLKVTPLFERLSASGSSPPPQGDKLSIGGVAPVGETKQKIKISPQKLCTETDMPAYSKNSAVYLTSAHQAQPFTMHAQCTLNARSMHAYCTLQCTLRKT